MIKNLVFSGGGVKGYSFIGCLKALEELNITQEIKAISSTSIGSLFSILFIIGYKSKELEQIFSNIDFNNLQNFEILNFKNNYGFDNGDNIIKFLQVLLTEKKIDPEITFLQLFEKTKIKFIITGTNISKQKIVYFNYKTYPDMKVLTALRITMSIPIIYEYIRFEDDIYVDGGLLDDYPIDYFRKEASETIGFLMYDYSETLNIEKLDEYLYSFLFCLLKKVNKFKKKIYKKNTILIKQNKVGTIDFNISKEDKIELFELGYISTKEFFKEKLDLEINNDKFTEILDLINN
jgi:NTE family protein